MGTAPLSPSAETEPSPILSPISLKPHDFVRIAARAGVDPRIAKLIVTSADYRHKHARSTTLARVDEAVRELGYHIGDDGSGVR
jgi:hypothetical protein